MKLTEVMREVQGPHHFDSWYVPYLGVYVFYVDDWFYIYIGDWEVKCSELPYLLDAQLRHMRGLRIPCHDHP